jgi:hypothetical protein
MLFGVLTKFFGVLHKGGEKRKLLPKQELSKFSIHTVKSD